VKNADVNYSANRKTAAPVDVDGRSRDSDRIGFAARARAGRSFRFVRFTFIFFCRTVSRRDQNPSVVPGSHDQETAGRRQRRTGRRRSFGLQDRRPRDAVEKRRHQQGAYAIREIYIKCLSGPFQNRWNSRRTRRVYLPVRMIPNDFFQSTDENVDNRWKSFSFLRRKVKYFRLIARRNMLSLLFFVLRVNVFLLPMTTNYLNYL